MEEHRVKVRVLSFRKRGLDSLVCGKGGATRDEEQSRDIFTAQEALVCRFVKLSY